MRTTHTLLLTLGLATAGIAAAQTPHPATKPMPARMPTTTAGRTTPSPAIIVQGGITPQPGCSPTAAGTGSTPSSAIGPKQDDPVGPHPNSQMTAAAVASSTGAVAIGPKQDDPSPPPPPAAGLKCTPAAH